MMMFKGNRKKRDFIPSVLMCFVLLVVTKSTDTFGQTSCVSGGETCCSADNCCSGILGSDNTCELSESGGSCSSNDDCAAGLVCVNDTCGCSNECDDSSCLGYDYCTCNPSASTCNTPSPTDGGDGSGSSDDCDYICDGMCYDCEEYPEMCYKDSQ